MFSTRSKSTPCVSSALSNDTTSSGHASNSSGKSQDRSAKFPLDFQTPRLTPDTIATNSSNKSACVVDSLLKHKAKVTSSARLSKQQTPYNVAGSSRMPGSRATPHPPSSTLHCRSTSIIALVEGRGLAKGEIGLACIDMRSSELILSQFSDGPTYVNALVKLQILNPVEIIMPNTAFENGKMSALYEIINEQMSDIPITTVQRKYFNEKKGSQDIEQLCIPEFNTVELDVQSKYYCLAATAALLKYVEFVQNVSFASNSLKVVYRGSEKTVLIDSTSVKNLELLQNIFNSKSKQSLFGVMDYTKTDGGARLLRSNILQPSCDLPTIVNRLESVEELTNNEEKFYNLQSVISKFLDVDRLISSFVQIPKKDGMKIFERRMTDVLQLKKVIELVESFKNCLEPCESDLFKAYYTALHDERYTVLRDSIQAVVHDESHYQKGTLNMRTQKVFAIKPNVNGLLDVARRTHCEVVDDIAEMIRQKAEDTGLPLTANYNNTRGFHIQISTNGNDNIKENLPPTFVKVVKARNTISCTTDDLIKLNARLDESLEEIYFLSNIVLEDLLKVTRENVGCLYKLSECISLLDMLVSFAHICTLSNYVRPEFTDTLAIKQGRHPVLDKYSSPMPPKANDTFASPTSNFVIVTGPNMSGKSTYLRQIALLQVMAQCGSFVPAEFSSFKLIDKIFVRIGNDDDIETNCSTFKLEMKEMNHIIRNCSDTSLLIIDELGRGTSIEEGVGIAYAISEYLIEKKALTFFATHFLQLCDLEINYSNVENYHFDVQRVTYADGGAGQLKFDHTLSKGRTQEEHYGISVAEMSTLPEDIMQKAREICQKLEANQKEKNKTTYSSKEKAIFKLASRLIEAAQHSRYDKEVMALYMRKLKTEFERDLAKDLL